jgi:uncharacterized protein YjcR
MKYRHHEPNSRKGYVHMVYDLFGAASARDLALKLGIKPSTAKSWINRWNRWRKFESPDDAGQTHGLRR